MNRTWIFWRENNVGNSPKIRVLIKKFRLNDNRKDNLWKKIVLGKTKSFFGSFRTEMTVQFKNQMKETADCDLSWREMSAFYWIRRDILTRSQAQSTHWEILRCTAMLLETLQCFYYAAMMQGTLLCRTFNILGFLRCFLSRPQPHCEVAKIQTCEYSIYVFLLWLNLNTVKVDVTNIFGAGLKNYCNQLWKYVNLRRVPRWKWGIFQVERAQVVVPANTKGGTAPKGRGCRSKSAAAQNPFFCSFVPWLCQVSTPPQHVSQKLNNSRLY